MSDLDLLQDYVRTNSQEAFKALVTRHLNLVYSAAHRQVRSSQLAEDVAQSVFLDLARHAARLRPDQPLTAWLFLVTRRTAVDVVRRESRRQAREQFAAEIAALKTPSPTWPQVKEVVDEAMESLSDAERSAVLLRFFENRSLREVGETLGVSEDTAQKRVSRALERLRRLLLRRGVAVSAAGLAADLSAHGVQAAPATLAASVTATAPLSALATGGTLLDGAQSIGLSAAQKAIAAAATAAVLGLGLYEVGVMREQSRALDAGRVRTAQLGTTLGGLRAETAAARQTLQAAQDELARSRLVAAGDPELDEAIRAWLQRVARLKQVAAERPALAVPELELVTEDQWFAAAKDADTTAETWIPTAFQSLRDAARHTVAQVLQRGLSPYSAAHDGRLPTDPAQLAPFLEPELSPAILARYEMLREGMLEAVPPGAYVIAERPASAARHESQLFVGARHHAIEDLNTVSDGALRRAVQAFAAANQGRMPAMAAELLAHLPGNLTQRARQTFLERPASDFDAPKLQAMLASH